MKATITLVLDLPEDWARALPAGPFEFTAPIESLVVGQWVRNQLEAELFAEVAAILEGADPES